MAVHTFRTWLAPVLGIAAACVSGLALAQPGPSLAPPKPLSAVAVAPVDQAPVAPRALERADVEAWLDGYMPAALARGDVAGAVVVVVKDGQVLLQKGYGYADVGRRRPVDPATTLFRPGSVSKLFTWTAMMQMVEQGKLDLDKDVNTYLDFKIPAYQGKPVTARNLMTHTAGFEESIKGLILSDPKHVDPLDVALKRWIPTRIFPPGEVPAYSNYGAALAGYLVQRLSGQPFDDYIDQHVFGPLGMTYASTRQPLPARLRPFMASGYKVASAPARPYELISLAPAGSSAVSGGDIAKFMIAHLQDGEYNGARILQPATARMMHGTPLTTINPALHRMLLGFYQTDRNGHRSISHGGDTAVFHSDLSLFPDDHVGLFVSLNSLGREGAVGPIRTALFNGFVDRYLPGPAPAQTHVDPAVAKADARAIMGDYEGSRRPEGSFMSLLNLLTTTKVVADAQGRISSPSLRGLNAQPQRFEEIAPFVWREVGGQDVLSVKRVNGKVVLLGAGEVAPFMTSLPARPWRDGAWLFPLLQLSLLALLFTGLLWPVAAIARRRYGAAFAYDGSAAVSHRLVRIGALAAAGVMIAWLVTVTLMLQTFTLTAAMDPWITVLHVLAVLAFPFAAFAAVWDAASVWRRPGGWRGVFGRLWSGVLVIASFTVLWVGLVFHLIGFGLNY